MERPKPKKQAWLDIELERVFVMLVKQCASNRKKLSRSKDDAIGAEVINEIAGRNIMPICTDCQRHMDKDDVSLVKEKHSKNSSKGKIKKSMKWKPALEMTSFDFSLLPHIQKETENDKKLSDDDDFDYNDNIDDDDDDDYRGYTYLEKYEGNGAKKRIRPAKKSRKEKVHKQIKSKYCRSLHNNNKKPLHIHHRVFKKSDIEPKRSNFKTKMPAKANKTCDQQQNKNKDKIRLRDVMRNCLRGMLIDGGRTRNTGVANAKNINATSHNPDQHLINGLLALDDSNVPEFFNDPDLINTLISLQHRELSPEDYDLLLQLDSSVATKTASENLLQNLKTDIVSENILGVVCAVCMESYALGQTRKYLPCNHIFHENCIDMWLSNSSLNCPLDGLPVEG